MGKETVEVWLKVGRYNDQLQVLRTSRHGPPDLSHVDNACKVGYERWIVFDLEIDPDLFFTELRTGVKLKVDDDFSARIAPVKASLQNIERELTD